MRVFGIVLLMGGCIWGCRPDLGEPDYRDQEVFDATSDFETELLPGPNPYVPGEERLSLGNFYEGERSQTLPIDQVTHNFWVYQVEGTEALTVELSADPDRIEGVFSDRLELQGKSWWGLGFHYYEEEDLSDWKNLRLSVRSSDPAFADMELKMSSGLTLEVDEEAGEEEPGQRVNEATAILSLAYYGYANDGEWHNLVIPLTHFESQGIDLKRISTPFSLNGGAGESGERAWIDALYLD